MTIGKSDIGIQSILKSPLVRLFVEEEKNIGNEGIEDFGGNQDVRNSQNKSLNKCFNKIYEKKT